MPFPLPAPPPFLTELDPLGQLFVRVFNRWARGQNITEALAGLEGKRVRIRATDAPLQLNLMITGSALKVSSARAEAHVTLRGRFADFVRLATRSEDPDTLFFQRRLCLEGETETGLAIKNALDALEWDWRRHLATLVPGFLWRLAQRLPCPPRGPFQRHSDPR